MNLKQLARFCGVRLVDYERDSSGLLVASGSGIMMAVMDHAPSLRWCVDVDWVENHERLVEFLPLAERFTSVIVIAGWFSITDPSPLQRAAVAMTRQPIVYAGHIQLGTSREVTSLAELLEQIDLEQRQFATLERDGHAARIAQHPSEFTRRDWTARGDGVSLLCGSDVEQIDNADPRPARSVNVIP